MKGKWFRFLMSITDKLLVCLVAIPVVPIVVIALIPALIVVIARFGFWLWEEEKLKELRLGNGV